MKQQGLKERILRWFRPFFAQTSNNWKTVTDEEFKELWNKHLDDMKI